MRKGVSVHMMKITAKNGSTELLPLDELFRCDNCGKPSDEAESCIAGGYLTDGEWACCEECYDEMVKKGCCFEELGNNVYRKQKY